MATTSEIKKGAVLLHKGKRMKVIEFLHVKPGKGGAFVRTKMKDIQTGKIFDETFNASAKIELIRVDAKTMQYLYADGEDFIFMDNHTYEQLLVAGNTVGEAKHYLIAGQEADLLFDGSEILDIRLPAHAILEVTHTEPGIRGNTATGATKPATLETGYEVQVPLFVDEGDKLKVDTLTGAYVERAKL